MRDKQGRPYATVAATKAGDFLEADGDFPCIAKGAVLLVSEGDRTLKREAGLWVPCAAGRHFLEGEESGEGDGAFFVGFYPAKEPTAL